MDRLPEKSTDVVRTVIENFDWWNYGMDDVDPRSKDAEWVAHLADRVVGALDAYVYAKNPERELI